MPPRTRLTALIEGVLAANIFDWGAKACVDLYHNGTILEIYRRALCYPIYDGLGELDPLTEGSYMPLVQHSPGSSAEGHSGGSP